MTYTWVDALVLFIVVLSTILAWSRGFTREALSIVGWIVALLVSLNFAYIVTPYIQDIGFIRDYISDSCEILTFISAVILFIIMMVIMSLITPLLSGFVKNNALRTIDAGLGAVFGLLRGLFLIVVAIMVYDIFIQDSWKFEAIDQSQSFALFATPGENVSEQSPENNAILGFFTAQFEGLTEQCRN